MDHNTRRRQQQQQQESATRRSQGRTKPKHTPSEAAWALYEHRYGLPPPQVDATASDGGYAPNPRPHERSRGIGDWLLYDWLLLSGAWHRSEHHHHNHYYHDQGGRRTNESERSDGRSDRGPSIVALAAVMIAFACSLGYCIVRLFSIHALRKRSNRLFKALERAKRESDTANEAKKIHRRFRRWYAKTLAWECGRAVLPSAFSILALACLFVGGMMGWEAISVWIFATLIASAVCAFIVEVLAYVYREEGALDLMDVVTMTEESLAT
jgi:hypothetical protein